MSLSGFKAKNHPQQTGARGPLDEVDDRGTTDDVYLPLHDEFRFTLDVAAAHHNARCESYYTRADDGLKQPWSGSVWCNPPYSDLTSWVEKAWQEWATGRCDSIVMLLPANRPEQQWWQTWVEPSRDRAGSPLTTRFLAGRRRFIMPGQAEVLPNQRPPFGLVVLVWKSCLNS